MEEGMMFKPLTPKNVKNDVIEIYATTMHWNGKRPKLKKLKELLSNPENVNVLVEYYKEHDITRRTYKAKKSGKDS